MTQEEYLQLIQLSPSFKKFKKEKQQQILKAEGDDRSFYEEQFLQERISLNKAQDELIEADKAAVRQFKFDVKNIHSDKRKNDEELSTKEEEKEKNRLIQKLNNI